MMDDAREYHTRVYLVAGSGTFRHDCTFEPFWAGESHGEVRDS